MSTISEDKNLILSYGGPTKLAILLGLDIKGGGVQRVQNWMSRGIPAKEKLARPDLLMPSFAAIQKPTAARRKSSRNQSCKNDNDS